MENPPKKEIVVCSQVSLRYGEGRPILQTVSFTLNEGSFYFLTGPSGAGKTTLIRMLYMGIRPTSGTLNLLGVNVNQASRGQIAKLRQRIGIVFQDFNLLPHLTVLENVILPLKVQGIDVTQRTQQAVELLRWVGLSDSLHVYPVILSGGQRQRVAIARAVITRPLLLLADEPTGNVDEKMALKLLYLFDELHKLGTAIVFATHHRDFAKVLGYPEIKVDQGQVVVEHSFTSSAPDRHPFL